MARRFGATWWGRAWIEALEQRASLDPNRLPRGRTYARKELARLDAPQPGRVRATVRGSRDEPYEVEIRLRPFDDDEWNRLLEVMVGRAGPLAALLDGELDAGLVEEARAVGIELLPDAGELRTWCSCPDWAEPCKHAAAVCYLIADTLDTDPFALLLLRGRARDEVVAEVRRRRSAGAGAGAGAGTGVGPDDGSAAAGGGVPGAAPAGMAADDAWARERPPLPHQPPPPARTGSWLAPLTEPPPGAGLSLAGLTALADDAARRAHHALAQGAPLHLRTHHRVDAARLAARSVGDTAALDRLAAGCQLTVPQLLRLAIAWTVAGADGVVAVDDARWRPEPLTMAAARQQMGDLHPGRAVRVDGNRIVVDGTQYRLGRDRRWYRLVKRSGTWVLDAGPADDPGDLGADAAADVARSAR